MSKHSRAVKAAERQKQDNYAHADYNRRVARRLDAFGFPNRADDMRREAEELDGIALRMETCPRVPR